MLDGVRWETGVIKCMESVRFMCVGEEVLGFRVEFYRSRTLGPRIVNVVQVALL